MLHDTEFSYQREKSEAIGITKSINSGRDKAGRLRSHTVYGILMHSSLAVTIEGVPLGLAAVKCSRMKMTGNTWMSVRPVAPFWALPDSHREKGKCPVVGKFQAVYATLGSSGTMHPYW
ncbi:hypothetical protein [Bradyrhizobium cajani]|uniref:hypothetical protein n=1 Tax=Bradyrhizobium cajani TaxID=1928661 RepID=UPI001FE3F30C|nr:hypothetical protein [Bradyrhizobium cajani]MCP3374419.1 hypothetical protein [Bradyrhizobium cajani]